MPNPIHSANRPGAEPAVAMGPQEWEMSRSTSIPEANPNMSLVLGAAQNSNYWGSRGEVQGRHAVTDPWHMPPT